MPDAPHVRFAADLSPADWIVRRVGAFVSGVGGLLFEGPLAAATTMGWQMTGAFRDPQSPNLFWPDDQAWCVAAEIDLDSTFVGGSVALIDDLLTDGRLEALPADLADPVSAWSDEVNR
jgi:hypothetical protein